MCPLCGSDIIVLRQTNASRAVTLDQAWRDDVEVELEPVYAKQVGVGYHGRHPPPLPGCD